MSIGRPRLGSLRNKLMLLILGVTASAFGVVYFFMVPQLASSLEDRKLEELTRVADASRAPLEDLMGNREATAGTLDRRVRAVSDNAGARVTLFGVQRSRGAPREPARFFVISDSREERSVPRNDALLARSTRTGSLARGRSTPDLKPIGELAQPLRFRKRVYWVALYSTSLEDVDETVAALGLPVWPQPRPKPVLWLAIDDGRGARLVGLAQAGAARAALDRAAQPPRG